MSSIQIRNHTNMRRTRIKMSKNSKNLATDKVANKTANKTANKAKKKECDRYRKKERMQKYYWNHSEHLETWNTKYCDPVSTTHGQVTRTQDVEPILPNHGIYSHVVNQLLLSYLTVDEACQTLTWLSGNKTTLFDVYPCIRKVIPYIDQLIHRFKSLNQLWYCSIYHGKTAAALMLIRLLANSTCGITLDELMNTRIKVQIQKDGLHDLFKPNDEFTIYVYKCYAGY